MPRQLEIAVTSASAATTALAHGADRIELCVALETGGVTPSRALIETTVEAGVGAAARSASADNTDPADNRTHVLVRCRPGDFVYSADEVQLMCHEARDAVRSGATGVVIGALTAEGLLDLDTVQRLADSARDAAPGIDITIHRAVDASTDPIRATAALAESKLNPTRILTSGGQTAAGDGAAIIAEMAKEAGTIQVMAGGGVTIAAIPALLGVGASAVHMSAKHRLRDHWDIDARLVDAARGVVDGINDRLSWR